MKKTLFLAVLILAAAATSLLADELKLSTIVPDQTVLRAKKGAIGENWSNPGTLEHDDMQASSFVVEGNVGIGTEYPQRRLHVHGDANYNGMRLTPSAPAASPAAGDIIIDSTDNNTLKWHDGTPTPGNGWRSAGAKFGERQTGLAVNTVHTAATDGFCVAMVTGSGGAYSWYGNMYGYADMDPPANNPTTVRACAGIALIAGAPCPNVASFTMPVKKGEKFKVSTASGASSYNIYWIPLN